ncbi:hypothetical protein V6N13_045725 [Hibiscus sabdariffa]
MKKASRLLFSNLNRHGFSVAASPILTRTYISPPALSSSPLNSTVPRLLQSPAKSHSSTFNAHRFLATQSFSKPREKSDLLEAFESAKTTEEMIRAFEDMEAMGGFFNKKELGIASLKLGRSSNEKLMGYYFHGLNGFDDLAISCFDMAATVLECIKRNGLVNSEDIMAMQHALQKEECVSDAEALCHMNWDKLLKIWGVGSVSLRAEIEAAGKQIALGKHDEAIYALAGIVEKTEGDGEDRALASILMGKALFRRGNLDDSMKWIQSACWILDKKFRAFPFEVFTAYLEMMKLHSSVKESGEVKLGDILMAPLPLVKRGNALQAVVYIRLELSEIYKKHASSQQRARDCRRDSILSFTNKLAFAAGAVTPYFDSFMPMRFTLASVNTTSF